MKKVRLDGGLPITLCDVPDEWGASWGVGDVILIADGAGLSRVSASGGSPSVVTKPDAAQEETLHAWPEILPDGKDALFTILTGAGTPRIGLLSLDTGEYRVIGGGSFARYVPTGHLVYVSEGVLLAAPFDLERLEVTGEPVSILEGVWTNPTFGTAHFALSPDGTLAYVPSLSYERTLVWVDRAGGVRPITEERRGYFSPHLSPDGHKVAVTIGGHIWVYEIARETLSQVTFSRNQEQWAIWTPDGSRLTFRRDDPPNIFWQPADGGGEAERLTTSENIQRPSSWSPDGRTLVYTESALNAQSDIALLTFDGESRASPFLKTPFNEAGGVFSPNGLLIAYVSDESGRHEIYVRPFPSQGNKWQISNEGGRQPVWARSGREIFYRNGDKMMAVPVGLDPAFRPGKPVALFEGEFNGAEGEFARYDVTLDNRHFVMVQETGGGAQIHIVLNWFEELKARVPLRPR